MQSQTYSRLGLLLVLAALLIPSVRAQNAPALRALSPAPSLRAQAARESIRHDADAASATELRARLDLPTTFTNAQGTYALVGTDNGLPVFMQTLGLASDAPARPAATRAPGGMLTGKQVEVGIWDGGTVRQTHQEVAGRTRRLDPYASVQTHATHIAGIIAGAGVEAQGLAPGATILSYDWGRDRAEMALAAATGLRVSNHSYGQTYGWVYNTRSDGRWVWLGNPDVDVKQDVRFGQYDWLAASWDEIAYNAPHYLMVKAAGNDRGEGPVPGTEHWIVDPVASRWVLTTDARDRDGGEAGYTTVLDAGNAKNVLTVGAVGAGAQVLASSAWGPTRDGRIKPDLAAYGYQMYSASASSDQSYTVMSGTSMAAASATGAVARLLELENTLAPAAPLRAATYRALLLHTADAAGTAPGPDYSYGWGVLNDERAAGVLEDGLRQKGHTQIREMQAAVGETLEMSLYAAGVQPLRVTIAWTDPEAEAGTASALVNDLDLEISDEAGQTYYPWVLDPANPAAPAQRGINTRDNVEQVVIDVPATGRYTLRVRFREQRGAPRGTVGVPQSFSLVATGLAEDSPSLPVELTGFEAVADARGVLLRWTTASETNNAGFGVEVQNAQAAVWREVAFVPGHGTTAEARRYTHTVPDLEAGRYRFRLRQVDFDGAVEYGPEVEIEITLEAPYSVATPAPNPFTDRLEAGFSVARAQQVRADVFDLMGRHVATVFDDYVAAQTSHRVGVAGQDLAAGVYLLVVQGEAFRHTERIVRVR